MKNSVCQSSSDVCKLTLIIFVFLSFMRLFRNGRGTGIKMRPAVVSGISTGTRQSAVACWPVTVPAVFAKVSSAQFTSRFKSGKLENVF